MYLVLILVLLCALLWAVGYIHRYCINPYFLHLVVGSKGSGKSLYMSKVADKWLRDHRGEVYSNMGIGCPLKEKYWLESYPPDSLILIDEIGVIHPDRDFKSFPHDCMEWYKMSRKRRLTIICSSQTMDVDKKIRMLCDRIYVCKKVSFLCMMTPYRAAIVMVENEEKGHDLVNDLKRSGKRVFYSVPKTALITEKLGYETEQIITRPSASSVLPAGGKEERKSFSSKVVRERAPEHENAV